jgi:hypothetical protein
MSMTQALGNFGPLPELDWKGLKLKMRHYCPPLLELLGAKLAEDALERASLFKGKHRQTKESDTLRAIDAGEFEPGGPRFLLTLLGPNLFAYTLWGSLHTDQPELTLADVKAILRDLGPKQKSVINQVMPGFFTAMELAGTAPGKALEMAAEWAKYLATQEQEEAEAKKKDGEATTEPTCSTDTTPTNA